MLCYLRCEVGDTLYGFECHSNGIFECILHPKEFEFIPSDKFSAYVGLKDIIKKLVTSNFIVTMIAVPQIIFTGDTYLCYSNTVDLVKIEDNTPKKTQMN